MSLNLKLERIISDTITNIKSKSYKGYDPYDALTSPYVYRYKDSNNLSLLMTVLFRFSPVNMRSALKTPEAINPKALGLIISSYVKLINLGIDLKIKEIDYLVALLVKYRSKNYSGISWGYPFPWRNRWRLVEKFEPSIVSTSFAANSLLDYYVLSKDNFLLDLSEKACDFIINNLESKEFNSGICFEYMPGDKTVVLNASALGASLLTRVSDYTDNRRFRDKAKAAFDFILSRQLDNGRWEYSYDYITDQPRKQTDWHQGFILDSLLNYVQKSRDKNVINQLGLGAKFYRRQFREDGSSFWRYNQMDYPINIHNQAQGIITFSRLSHYFPEYLELAEKILGWTLENLYSNEGTFYYQKGRFFKNKIIYIRWSQSWMLLAMATYLEACKNKNETISKE